jgi:CheY-like chemotaxis protein/HPt (histidine-containing phosphotransfer) domain-containing protein
MGAEVAVLLVEDHLVNQKVVRRMLERLGCAVDVAGDGEIGVASLAPRHGLVLMDCSMPRCDGFEATRRIRAMEGELARTPVVALTAHATPADRERCLASGMDHWLPKPVQPEDLVQVLRRFTTWSAAPPPTFAEGVLDLRVVTQLVQLGGTEDPEFFPALVADFAELTDAGLVEACAHHAALRGFDLRRTMHRLKSASSTIGAVRLREVCGKLADANDLEIRQYGTHWLAIARQELGLASAALAAVPEMIP